METKRLRKNNCPLFIAPRRGEVPLAGRWETFPLFCAAFAAAFFIPAPWRAEARRPTPGNPSGILSIHGKGGAVIEKRSRPAETTDLDTLLQLEKSIHPVLEESAGEHSFGMSGAGVATGALQGLPRPLRSRLLVDKRDLGGAPASFLVYESWGSAGSIADFLRSDFAAAGWDRNADLEALAGRDLPGLLLSYSRGGERCLMHVGRVPETGKIETLVLYTDLSGLQPDSGF